MKSVFKYQSVVFAAIFIVGSFFANAQKEEKNSSNIYSFDKEGNILVIEGYDVIEMKNRTVIYEEAKWKPVKIKGGTLGLIEKASKSALAKNNKANDYSECEKCTDGEVCVIKGDTYVCQKEKDCNCEPNEICVNGKCELQKLNSRSKLKKSSSILIF